ncbi:TonB-dependent receptor [Stenotrophomonas sp. S41]|uniref:TonB-dependent receptor plug domain-containing protein n=1 Tax=Stenotrophomonas sp. S41 TaxID=2767464 RepID=UPI0019091FD0|nr:TonB-dependent receptor [Stenotrophomonas sp. S41]MBK0011662.1 TonB-dependent receptor [Stenotrophomonas sp. S41]
MIRRRTNVVRHPLSLALLGSLLATALPAFAQDSKETTDLGRVTVTGSLIPQTQVENHTPVLTVTAEDIQTRGFTSIAEVLQQSSLTTGGLQGGQSSAAFTQGAEAAGMFGLDPGYTKYLINGRPMLQYPALYNGSDAFNNISGIPIDIVERIEILPGGQSSLYGSDAIAGVVNIILKKRMDGGTINVRGGAYTEGGGNNVRVSVAKGFNSADDRFNALFNVQYEKSSPIWGYQRDLTKVNNPGGYSAQVPSNDFLVYLPDENNAFVMMDPTRCASVAGQFGGTTELGVRAAGESCGSKYSAGYRTIKNAKESSQFYSSLNFQVNENFELFAEALYSLEEINYVTGSGYTFWSTGPGFGYIYDQDTDQYMSLQRAFAPEDIGGQGYRDIQETNRNKAYQITLGGRGTFGTNWDYSASFSRGEYKLTERGFARWAEPIDSWFEQNVFGPVLGQTDDGYNIYSPNWGAFYSQLPAGAFQSFTGYTYNQSRTWQNLGRVQLTNSGLFSLPGGDAGLGIVVEGGSEGWDYSPDARLLNGDVWGTTSVAGAGHRSNCAVTGELRLPLLDSLTVTGSGRYDAFKIADNTVDKSTYSIGVEFRPIESLLFRGKYGTAFRAPSLPDAFQGESGFYTAATDYYRCAQLGFAPADTVGCPYADQSTFGVQSGNPELEPITADVWNAGVVWAPMANLSLSVDYYRWKIENEVDTLSSDQLLRAEYYCRNNLDNNTNATCQNVADWVTRDASGNLDQIYTPKLNVARQNLNALTASFKYVQDIGRFGSLQFASNYTNILKREVQPQTGDDYLDLLRDPYAMWNYQAFAKVRADGSIGWAKNQWTTTLYYNYIGRTPNYMAYLGESYDYVHSSGYKAGKWGSYTTYNLSVSYRAMDNLTLSLMVNNVFNKNPSSQRHSFGGNSSAPYNENLYNPYGRAIYAQMQYDFGAK